MSEKRLIETLPHLDNRHKRIPETRSKTRSFQSDDHCLSRKETHDEKSKKKKRNVTAHTGPVTMARSGNNADVTQNKTGAQVISECVCACRTLSETLKKSTGSVWGSELYLDSLKSSTAIHYYYYYYWTII